MKPPRGSTRLGFTLVEVLLGTLLLLVVLGIVLLLIRSVTAVQSNQLDRSNQHALDAFHQELGDRLTHLTSGPDCELETRNNHLRFCTIEIAGPKGETDLIRWKYSLLEDNELEVVRIQGRGGVTNLLAGVTRFAAFSRSGVDSDWGEAPDGQELPGMLRVESTLTSGESGACDVYIPASLTTRSQIERH